MFQIARHSLLIVGLILLSPTLLWAQEEFITDSTTQKDDTVSSYRYKALKQAGNQLFEEGPPFASLHFFETALNKVKGKKRTADMLYALAKANFIIRDYDQAKVYLDSLREIKRDRVYVLHGFMLSSVLMFQGEYSEALAEFSKFIETAKRYKSLAYENALATHRMQSCQWALNQEKEDVEEVLWRAYHLDSSVNGPSSDYGPHFTSNSTLTYSQLRNTKEVSYISKNEADYPSQVRITSRQDTLWQGSETFYLKGTDSLMLHIGNYASGVNTTSYFTHCILDSMLNSECVIYENFQDSLRKLGPSINLSGSSATEPFYANQGSYGRLYFTSNRPGGYGGYDLYYADKLEDGSFGVPVNLGPKINTFFDERTAYFDIENNLLFFASEGYLGFGGLDMFSSHYNADNETYGQVENLLKPVNSSYDDYGLHISPNGQFGAIASNRDSSLSMRNPHCCDDIFMLNTTERSLTVIGQTYTMNNEGRVLLDSVEITLYRAEQDTLPLDGALSTRGDFNYNIEFRNQYMVIAEKPGYSDDSVSFSLDQPRKAQFSDTLYVELELQKTDSNFNPDSFLVATVYWDFDKHMLREDAIDSIKKVYNFLGQNPGYGIAITSHTDAMGTDRYNQSLSERRSQSVYNYLLTDLGFPVDRMRWNGLGERYPVAPNRLPNGRDNKEGRQLNRRTEFWAYPIR